MEGAALKTVGNSIADCRNVSFSNLDATVKDYGIICMQ